MIEPDNPCTIDCPDRPNCKGCARGNAYRQKKIEESEERFKKNSYHHYEIEMIGRAKDKAAKKRSKYKRAVYRD